MPISKRTTSKKIAKSAGAQVLEFAILGLLKEHSLHGYELRRRLSELLGPIGRLSFGTLYPALNRLEKEGAVEVLDVTKSRTGLTTTRGRKVYGITEKGQIAFNSLLDTASARDDDKTFNLRLAFARYLSGEARLRLLQRRQETLIERLNDDRSTLEETRDQLDEYSRSLMEHRIDTAERDVIWLGQLISREQNRLHLDANRPDPPNSLNQREQAKLND